MISKPTLPRSLQALALVLCTLLTSYCYSELQKAPTFQLPGIDGSGKQRTIALAQQAGKVVYLDFWASWCVPCRQSFPWMEQMHQRYHSQGLVVIAINLDAEPQLATDFLIDYPSNFLIAFDNTGLTPKQYKVMGMPSAYLINKQGDIIASHIGFNIDKKSGYETAIQQALSE